MSKKLTAEERDTLMVLLSRAAENSQLEIGVQLGEDYDWEYRMLATEEIFTGSDGKNVYVWIPEHIRKELNSIVDFVKERK